MKTKGLHVFDETVQLAHTWVKELMERLETEDAHFACLALRATLHALRDQLPPAAMARLAAQLPTLVRGIFYEDWQPSRRRIDAGDVLGRIAAAVGPDRDARNVAQAVVGLLSEKLSIGEVGRMVHALPPELRSIWLQETTVLTADPPALPG